MEIRYVQEQPCSRCGFRQRVCLARGPQVPAYDQAYRCACASCAKPFVFYPAIFKMEFGSLTTPVQEAQPDTPPPPGEPPAGAACPVRH